MLLVKFKHRRFLVGFRPTTQCSRANPLTRLVRLISGVMPLAEPQDCVFGAQPFKLIGGHGKPGRKTAVLAPMSSGFPINFVMYPSFQQQPLAFRPVVVVEKLCKACA